MEKSPEPAAENPYCSCLMALTHEPATPVKSSLFVPGGSLKECQPRRLRNHKDKEQVIGFRLLIELLR
jgi:hypothetical protein